MSIFFKKNKNKLLIVVLSCKTLIFVNSSKVCEINSCNDSEIYSLL